MKEYDAVCAGHICIDLIPNLDEQTCGIEKVFIPGKVVTTGSMHFSLGGSVANTGLALRKIGMHTSLMANVGADQLGKMVKDVLADKIGSGEALKTIENAHTSYSVVLSLPATDRIFLHNSGANHTFMADDIDYSVLKRARLFHFGYPPVMKSLYENDGKELIKLFKNVKATGVTTSLDMCLPDPNSQSGKLDWEGILSKTLKYVDIFLPSVEEIIFMLDRTEYTRLKEKAGRGDITDYIDLDYIPKLGEKLIDMGVKVLVIKCGNLGLYLKTAKKGSLLLDDWKAKTGNIDEWADKEMFSSIYKVDRVKSTTGAGDTSIAGFLAAFLKEADPATAIKTACAVGALCVQSYSADELIEPYSKIQQLIDSGWDKRSIDYNGQKWRYDQDDDVWMRL